MLLVFFVNAPPPFESMLKSTCFDFSFPECEGEVGTGEIIQETTAMETLPIWILQCALQRRNGILNIHPRAGSTTWWVFRFVFFVNDILVLNWAKRGTPPYFWTTPAVNQVWKHPYIFWCLLFQLHHRVKTVISLLCAVGKVSNKFDHSRWNNLDKEGALCTPRCSVFIAEVCSSGPNAAAAFCFFFPARWSRWGENLGGQPWERPGGLPNSPRALRLP